MVAVKIKARRLRCFMKAPIISCSLVVKRSRNEFSNNFTQVAYRFQFAWERSPTCFYQGGVHNLREALEDDTRVERLRVVDPRERLAIHFRAFLRD